MKNFFILSIVILLTNSSLVLAQSQSGSHPGCFFNLQFVMILSWGNETAEPISPGETREIHLTISSTVTRGAYGRILLQILEGGTYPIQLSVEEKPEWCIAWTSQENFTGVILPNEEMCTQNTLLYIHLNDDAPSNSTLGWVKIRCTINDKKGPFNILTLIHGYENTFTLSFITGP